MPPPRAESFYAVPDPRAQTLPRRLSPLSLGLRDEGALLSAINRAFHTWGRGDLLSLGLAPDPGGRVTGPNTMTVMDPVVARKMWRTLEPYHGAVYFLPEAREAYAGLGVTDRMMGYFGSRAAPMGPVPAEVVIATFFNFHPSLVTKRVPKVWSLTTPDALIQARLQAADAMLRRVLGEAVGSPEMSEAASLARRAAEACRSEGRPLYAGHASLPWPGEPHLVLWHAVTLLREFRGDGHIAALLAAGLDGCESLITHAAAGEVPAETLKTSRAWPDDDWDAAVERLRARGWIGEDGSFTPTGAEARHHIEENTDRLALRAWEELSEDECTRLRALVRPFSRAIVDSGEFAFPRTSTDW